MVPIELLSRLPIFAGMDEPALAAVARLAHMRVFDRGECVFLEGAPMPRLFHVLITGTVQIVKVSQSGKETALRVMRPGELFGWAALLDGGVAPATARCAEPSRVLKLPEAELVALLAQEPKVALRLLSTLSERLRDVHEQLHAVASERARTRLARLILRYQAREGARLETPLPHQVLARMAGIAYEESVRIVGEWTHCQPPVLAYGRGGKITVLDTHRLAALAEGAEVVAGAV